MDLFFTCMYKYIYTIYIDTHIHVYIYIYMYTYTEKELLGAYTYTYMRCVYIHMKPVCSSYIQPSVSPFGEAPSLPGAWRLEVSASAPAPPPGARRPPLPLGPEAALSGPRILNYPELHKIRQLRTIICLRPHKDAEYDGKVYF